MNKEYRFLIRACGIARDLYTDDERTLICGEKYSHLDGEMLVAMANQHKVSELLYTVLPLFPDVVSLEIKNTLKQIVIENKILRAQIVVEWKRLAVFFKENNIRWMTLKGPAASIQL